MIDPGETEVFPQPEQIGGYRIVRILGEGGFGRVYLAQDEQLQRAVAIKVPRPERLAVPDEAKAYLTEARTVAGLDHPHIVPIFNVGTTPGASATLSQRSSRALIWRHGWSSRACQRRPQRA